MKKFRKISALALVLVLVCLCAASAFAVTVTGGHDYNYFDTSLTVTAEDYLVSSSIYAPRFLHLGNAVDT